MPNSQLLTMQFQVNGQTQTANCSAGTSLLSLLRQQGWMGVHRVCETGDCGSCTVWVNDKVIHSCIYPALRVEDASVTTIEGIAQNGLSPMQQAFLQEQGFQCGYCTPGMIMSAEKLDWENEADLRRLLDGNICRCTGYQAIVESILKSKNQDSEVSQLVSNSPISNLQVGQSIPKQDGLEIVTGKPIYTADWSPPGLLHLKVVRSPHPHARIRNIDTTQAKSIPGVRAIFTHEDVPRRAYSTAGHSEPVPDPHDHYLLDNKVRFVGDRVAAVVAETEAIAEFACQQIQVNYEILPHILDPVTSAIAYQNNVKVSIKEDLGLSPNPIIHDEPDSYKIHDAKNNISGQIFLEQGDIEAGFAEADLIVEKIYHLPAVQHFHLEPHVSITWIDENGTLVVRSSTQVPFHCQRLLSQLFDLPIEKVRVFKTQIGGGFGNKQEILTEDLCALATLKTGCPVQWQFNRKEEFTATNSRHAMQITLKIGAKRDGTLTAMDMEAIANTGAYGNHGTQVIFLTGTMPLGLYRCPNQRYLGLSVYTNTMPAGAFRGYGATQGFFAVECLLDEIAAKLHLDPLELRRGQLITPTEAMLIGRDRHFKVVGSCGLDEALDRVSQAINYQPGMPPVIEGHLRRGVGFAVAMQGSGLAKIHTARVRMSLKLDGRYELRTGAVDLGTGCDTTLRQIAADVLGTTLDQIDIITADTATTPFDAGAYASATTYITGQAVILAAQDLQLHLQNHAELLNIQDLQFLAQKLETMGELVAMEREYAADRSTLTFTVQGVEVEVDTETGRIKVLRCVQAIDIGKAINPRICHGQAIGGMVMGLGYALQEELQLGDRGEILNPTPRTYRLPLAKDIPSMELIFIEKSDPYGPFGAKGVGEVTINCIAPAIVNAVAHATGIRLQQLPLTPERVWEAINNS